MALRMPLIDILHRTLLFGLVGMGTGGIFLGWQVHRDVLRRGKGAGKQRAHILNILRSVLTTLPQLAQEMEAQKEAALREGKEIENEKALAEAAQLILKSRNP